MKFIHVTKKVPIAGTVEVPDGDVFAGSHIEANPNGSFDIVLHVLQRSDGAPVQPQTSENKEFRQ